MYSQYFKQLAKGPIWMAFALVVLLLGACGTTVHMTGTWKATDAPAGGYHKILITSLSSNMGARQTIETDLAATLAQKGLVTGRSLDMFPPNFDPKNEVSRKDMAEKIRAAGYTAILTTSLINKESETRYVPGTMMYAPYPAYGWYGSFWGYYGYMYGTVYSPGYYTTDKTYFLESNLYDLNKDGRLIWSGQSETVNPSSLASFGKAFSKRVADALQNEGLLSQ
ncbi:hypothetical protein CLV59_106210 [Chitinophaga dinghuensis]|uniref:DUF4136 domain-containing protein n=1 Tax=Chitinophaga dinghuensis TaxID=1539050 RepID=A0A327VTC0_9BACT|nr:hypothetical protein [Chitinophaga dinghuensis]RAJ79149.1 hypothetical protein CLV59_106210 [Chitinophaga dinghuensis]